jgi:hypothetical protein
VAGEPIPPLPHQDDPDDLLDASEVGELAGIAAVTVLRYVLRETIIPDPDETIYGQPHWRRGTIEEWLPNRPGRGAGGGRRTASGLSDGTLIDLAMKFRLVLNHAPSDAAGKLGLHVASLEKLLTARDSAIQREDQARAESRRVTTAVKRAAPKERGALVARARELAGVVRAAEEEHRAADAALRKLLLGVPALPADELPAGPWFGVRELGRLLDVSPMKASKILVSLPQYTPAEANTRAARPARDQLGIYVNGRYIADPSASVEIRGGQIYVNGEPYD